MQRIGIRGFGTLRSAKAKKPFYTGSGDKFIIAYKAVRS